MFIYLLDIFYSTTVTYCVMILFHQNGFNGVRTSAALDCKKSFFSYMPLTGYRFLFLHAVTFSPSLPWFLATSSSSTPKPESPSLGSSSTSVAPSVPSSLLPPSVTPHSSALSSLAPELPSASLPPLSRWACWPFYPFLSVPANQIGCTWVTYSHCTFFFFPVAMWAVATPQYQHFAPALH